MNTEQPVQVKPPEHYEQLGYDQWTELWCNSGSSPTATMCGARYMDDGPNRQAFIRGWNKAKNEHQGATK